MPIVNIQRRMAEQGRIRLGKKTPTSSGKTRPEKLDRFRFTSGNERLINDIAQLYGGTAQPWDNAGKAEFEVITDAKSIPVIVVKGGFSQWMETWSGGGCQHRCDGERQVDGTPCNPDDPAHQQAKPTTRLSVMLADVETLGVWRLESHGWNAAAELPMLAELAAHVGELVPASLVLQERKAIKDGKTSRFVVPVLDLHVSKQKLVAIAGGNGTGPAGAAQIGGTQPAQISAGVAAPKVDWEDLIAQATSTEDLQGIWHQAGQAGVLTDDLKDRIISAGRTFQPTQATAAVEDPVEGEVEPDDAVEAAWMTVVTIAGQNGWTLPMLNTAFEQWAALPVADADVTQINEFLSLLRQGQIDAPQGGAA